MYKFNCVFCEKDFLCRTNRKRKNHFCSHDCYAKWLKIGDNESSKAWFKDGQTGYFKGKSFSKEHRRKISKSRKEKADLVGRISRNWQGGRIFRKKYIYIFRPEHPHAGTQGYVAEHRLVVEGVIGRILDPIEVVHHIDKDKQNNSPNNLILFKNESEHSKHHWKLKRENAKAT